MAVIKLLIYIKDVSGVFDHVNEKWCHAKEVKLVHLWIVEKRGKQLGVCKYGSRILYYDFEQSYNHLDFL